MRAWAGSLVVVAALCGLVASIIAVHRDPVGFPDGVAPLLRAELTPIGGAPEVVALPHDWRGNPNYAAAWYRLRVPIESPETVAWSIYLPRSSPISGLRVGGTPVALNARAGNVATDLSYRLVPQIFSLPLGLFEGRELVVDVLLEVAPGVGYMGRVFVGPTSDVVAGYNTRAFVQVTAMRVIFVGLMCFAGVMVAAYSLRRRDSVPIWLALTYGLSAAGMWNVATEGLPLPHPPTTFVGNGWMLFVLTLLTHRLHDLHRPRLERAFFAFAVFSMATRFLIPEGPLQTALRPPLFSLIAIAGVYAMSIVVHAQLTRRRPEQDFISAAMATLFIGSVHDMLMLAGWIPRTHDLVMLYAVGVSALFFAWVFVRRFISALESSEQLTDELEARVAARERDLEKNYARLAELERERGIARERTRLMEELHDGTGGQISSALAMLQSPDTGRDAVRLGLRRALQDMRLIVYSLEQETGDLGTLLGLLRDQLEPALEAAGVRLRWDVRDTPMPAGYGPESALNVARIVQEGVSNVIEHAGAQTVTVRTNVETGADGRPCVVVTVEDDGQGIPTEPGDGKRERGRGVPNMHRRAERIGAELRVVDARPGTRMQLVLPLERAVREG
jgi:signal transduction histidine kinase